MRTIIVLPALTLIAAFVPPPKPVAATTDTKENASLISVVQGLETSGIDLELTVRSGGSVSGHVYQSDGRTPAEYASVFLYDLPWWEISRWTWTDEQGYYRIRGLPAGQYYLLAGEWSDYCEQRYYEDSETEEDATPVGVAEGVETGGIDFSLPVGGSISGYVYEADGQTPISGWAWVEAYDMEWNYSGQVRVEDNGHYRVGGLEEGAYYLRGGLYSNYVPQYYRQSATRDGATLVSVLKGTETTGINFSLVSGGFISGHVLEDDGHTAVSMGTLVYAYDVDWELVGFDLTNSDGSYRIGGFVEGHYYIEAGSSSEYLPRYYPNSPTEEGAAPVTVAGQADTRDIDFSLSIGGSISGRVYEAGSETPASRWSDVYLYDPGWGLVEVEGVDEGGYYRFRGLETGRYYVSAGGRDSEYVTGYYSCETQFQVEMVRKIEGEIVVRWASKPGRSYRILVSSDLLAWSELQPTISGPAGQPFCEWTDTDGDSLPLRFYRIEYLTP